MSTTSVDPNDMTIPDIQGHLLNIYILLQSPRLRIEQRDALYRRRNALRMALLDKRFQGIL